MKQTICILSIICGTSSLINAISHVFDIGIASLFVDYFVYFRNVMNSLIFPLIDILNIPNPPALYLDLWPLSFVAAGAYSWAFSETLETLIPTETPRVLRFGIFNPIGRFITVTLAGFSMTGLLIFVFAVISAPFLVFGTSFLKGHDDERLWKFAMPRLIRHLLFISSASIVFFFLNAFAPSA